MSRAIGLLSGGLDSSLAALALKRQGVDVTGLAFVTPFFGSANAERAAELMQIPLIVEVISEVHLEMLKNPRYGYGNPMNPCLACHALMFRLAGEVMERDGFDFLFSGEVLGQRPMSQNASALQAVAKHSGYPKRILRPLSAKLLPITPMEEEGLVKREELLDIQGRSRRRQQELAKEWQLTDYPSSGGGCLLTEKSFSGRLRDLLSDNPEASVRDIELLKLGRQFRLGPAVKLVLGRNRSDNEALQRFADPSDYLLRAHGYSGPLGIVTGTASDEQLKTASAIVATYGKGAEASEVEIQIRQGDAVNRLTVPPLPRDTASTLQIF